MEMTERCEKGEKLGSKETRAVIAYYTREDMFWGFALWEKMESARLGWKSHLSICEQCRKAESEAK